MVWALGHFGVTVGAEEAAVIAGGATTVVLLIGRKGLKGVWDSLLHGKE